VRRLSQFSLIAFFLTVGPIAAQAQPDGWVATGDVSAALAVKKPQSDQFGPGASGALGVYHSAGSRLLFGLRLRSGFLSNGDAPTDPGQADPGVGTFSTGTLAARLLLAPPPKAPGKTRGLGPWIEVAAGPALTGEEIRPAIEAGLGWTWAWRKVAIGPAARYLQILQKNSDVLDGRDASVVLLGLEIALAGTTPVPQAPEPEAPPAPADRDNDGIVDLEDACPDSPEDLDGFEDSDGCPDPDNDDDSILDVEDACPNEPEDFDGFEDEDGCPDPDNDQDGILDADDACPNEPETINGNNDDDGCPDEGLIELVNDRVTLEDTILFDFERARVRTRAHPVLRAIISLWQQHPEWLSMRVEGHADFRGNEAFNQKLSERRARNVVRKLVRMGGLPEDIFEYAGYGSKRPRVDGESDEELQQNRRVEFIAISAPPPQPKPVTPAAEPSQNATPQNAAPKKDTPEGAPLEPGLERSPVENEDAAESVDANENGDAASGPQEKASQGSASEQEPAPQSEENSSKTAPPAANTQEGSTTSIDPNTQLEPMFGVGEESP